MNRHIHNIVSRYPIIERCSSSIQAALDLLVSSFTTSGKALLCGNGGSASDCEHIVGELMKSFLLKRPIPVAQKEALKSSGKSGKFLACYLQGGLPCIALTGHPALSSAIANDVRANLIFAQQVYVLGRPGDVLWGISTSGNSENVINAFHIAKERGLRTLALTGKGGGKLAPLADVAVCVPAISVTEIQELHLPIYHALCAALEETFFSK